jgi:hypothetical protein
MRVVLAFEDEMTNLLSSRLTRSMAELVGLTVQAVVLGVVSVSFEDVFPLGRYTAWLRRAAARSFGAGCFSLMFVRFGLERLWSP